MAINASGLRTPRTSRLRLAPLRSEQSVAIEREAPAHLAMPPFVRWDQFERWFLWERDNGRDLPSGWPQGQHVTLVGGWGAGKTTLARQLLRRRDYVVVMATKKRDPSLYEPLLKEGFVIRDRFDPDPGSEPKVIFQPKLDAPTAEAMEAQREQFREALIEIYREGGWCVYCDEVRYLSDNLNLKTELEVLWLQGRSLEVTLVVGTQRPVSIPLLAFDADHLFLWRATEREDIRRISEFTGENTEAVRYTIPRLPRHEALYNDTRTDVMARTKVSL